MAINETISTGNKYRRLKDATNKVWQRLSFWTKASDVEFDNGSTAEEALGSITGITDSVNSTSSNVAASAKAVSTLNSNLTNVSTAADNINLYVGDDGKLHWVNKAGADSALNFSSYDDGVAAAKVAAKIAYYPHYSTNVKLGGVANNTWTCNYCGATLGGQGQSSGVMTWGSCQTQGAYISWNI